VGYDLVPIQGAPYDLRVVWKDNGDPPQPIPLTGYRAHMQIRTAAGGRGVILADLTSEVSGGGLVVEPGMSTGVITIHLDADATQELSAPAFYDLFVISRADDEVTGRLLCGRVLPSLSVTQETS
jgi:hypothetical protein